MKGSPDTPAHLNILSCADWPRVDRQRRAEDPCGASFSTRAMVSHLRHEHFSSRRPPGTIHTTLIPSRQSKHQQLPWNLPRAFPRGRVRAWHSNRWKCAVGMSVTVRMSGISNVWPGSALIGCSCKVCAHRALAMRGRGFVLIACPPTNGQYGNVPRLGSDGDQERTKI